MNCHLPNNILLTRAILAPTVFVFCLSGSGDSSTPDSGTSLQQMV